jgi:hypothetical protein
MLSDQAVPQEFPKIAEVYERFAALTAISFDLGGWLVLYAGLNRDGIALAMASNVAGAASLGVEPDAERAKQAVRAGVCDFLVNHLDEALRILKNEIRKRRTVSVILTGDVDSVVREIVMRGVQPEILTFPVTELLERGARMLAADEQHELIPVTWSVASKPLQWLPVVDALASAALEIKDARVRWLESAPRYLGREFAEQRYLRMTDVEADGFVAAIREAVTAVKVPVAVSVERDGEPMTIAT